MHRYVVYHPGVAFAWVHAHDEGAAIAMVLMQVQRGFRPEDCTAIRFKVRPNRQTSDRQV